MADNTIAPKEFSRKAAKAASFKFYHGKPCSKHFVTKRYTSSGNCVKCIAVAGAAAYEANPDRVNEWRQKQDLAVLRAKRAKEAREWRQRNPDKAKAVDKINRLRYGDIHQKNWHKNNPDKVRASERRYRSERRASDIDYKLRGNLRTRLNRAIRGDRKAGSAVRDLGCSIAEFREHIASQFTGGMAWENWGALWELDHKIPLSSFDLTDREQFLSAAHHTNYQPLSLAAHKEKSAAELRKAA